MMIIVCGNYVAGIFADPTDVECYLSDRPVGVDIVDIIEIDLQYPFYLLEDNGHFRYFQTEEAARHAGGAVLYTISEDYQPLEPWTDFMGCLPHEHLTDT